MYDHPHIVYMLWKQRQEERMAECLRIQKVRTLRKKKTKPANWISNIMLSVADLLIKAGTSLKRRWTMQRDDSGNSLASPLKEN